MRTDWNMMFYGTLYSVACFFLEIVDIVTRFAPDRNFCELPILRMIRMNENEHFLESARIVPNRLEVVRNYVICYPVKFQATIGGR